MTRRTASGTIGEMDRANESQSEGRWNFAALIHDGMTSGDGSDLDHVYFCGMRERIRDAETQARRSTAASPR